jgi:hypothetical protein
VGKAAFATAGGTRAAAITEAASSNEFFMSASFLETDR